MTDLGHTRGMPTLADLLHYNVRHFGEHIALRIDDDSVTWRQLDTLVERSCHLLAQHIEPQDRVGIWMQNSAEWVAQFIAINALGGVSIPISTRLTPAELDVIMRDAGARVLVTTPAYRGRQYFDEAVAQLVAPDRAIAVLAAQRGDDAWRTAGAAHGPSATAVALPDDLLCIQYTSGTTSTPKGVMLTARNYLRTAKYVASCQRLTPSSRFISAGPFFHCSGSMHALTVCLLAGCTLTSMSIWDPERFLDGVRRYRCDVAHMIFLRDVLALGDPGARAKLASLQVAHDLGTRDYLLRVHDELGIAGISNIYGMTETAGQFTMWYPDDPLEKRISANGRAQWGNALRIGDPVSGLPLAAGATGEIQMKGATITSGYFNRPQADKEAFTVDGWLRSGDIGSLSDSGELTYLARSKELIRTGGENFAPAEVEQAMHDHCQLGQVCVLGVPHERLDEIPAAVVLDTLTGDWEKVVAELRRRIAGFKVPKAIYVTESFPLTMTNKVQRSVLKEWIAKGKLKRVL